MFTILFAVLNGLSVYLTIPLLDTLFQESASKQATVQTNNIEKASSILPDWIINLKDEAVKSFNDFVLSGDRPEVLIKICFLILTAFLLKNIFGYLQGYFMAFVEYASMKDLRDNAYKHLHKLPIGYFKSEKVGNII